MLLSLPANAVVPLSPHATPHGVGQHLDSARTGRHATVEHSTTGSTDHPEVPRQLVRRPMPGHRGEGQGSRRSAITTASDARMPMAEQGSVPAVTGMFADPNPAVSPARWHPAQPKTDDMPTS